MGLKPAMRRALSLTLLAWVLGACAQEQAAQATAVEAEQALDTAESRYGFERPSRDGIGKIYMGREISHVMGHLGAGWLGRPERERMLLLGWSPKVDVIVREYAKYVLAGSEVHVVIGEVPSEIRGAVRNNGGGHVNHTMFWDLMSPDGGGEPTGGLADAINETFGSFDGFKEQFAAAAMTRFGSGWAWLCVNSEGDLAITSTANQDNPVFTDGMAPILGLDVWEHAYYLNYQNRRPEYIEAWWNTVNWDAVSAHLTLVKVGSGVAQLTDWAEAQMNKLTEFLGKLTD